jgi:hypothetical protein
MYAQYGRYHLINARHFLVICLALAKTIHVPNCRILKASWQYKYYKLLISGHPTEQKKTFNWKKLEPEMKYWGSNRPT